MLFEIAGGKHCRRCGEGPAAAHTLESQSFQIQNNLRSLVTLVSNTPQAF
jgi:hypothetical protein